jgi:hypothetical protein
MVLPDSDRVPRAPPYLGYALVGLAFAYATITLYGGTFQTLLLTSPIRTNVPQPQWEIPTGLGSTDFARHYYRYLY